MIRKPLVAAGLALAALVTVALQASAVGATAILDEVYNAVFAQTDNGSLSESQQNALDKALGVMDGIDPGTATLADDAKAFSKVIKTLDPQFDDEFTTVIETALDAIDAAVFDDATTAALLAGGNGSLKVIQKAGKLLLAYNKAQDPRFSPAQQAAKLAAAERKILAFLAKYGG